VGIVGTFYDVFRFSEQTQSKNWLASFIKRGAIFIVLACREPKFVFLTSFFTCHDPFLAFSPIVFPATPVEVASSVPKLPFSPWRMVVFLGRLVSFQSSDLISLVLAPRSLWIFRSLFLRTRRQRASRAALSYFPC